MGELSNIKARLMEELEAYGGGIIGKADLDTIHKLSATIKDIEKIEQSIEPSYYSGSTYSDGRAYDSGRDSKAAGIRRMQAAINELVDDPNISYADREALKRARKFVE